jgi:hypothetical protein
MVGKYVSKNFFLPKLLALLHRPQIARGVRELRSGGWVDLCGKLDQHAALRGLYPLGVGIVSSWDIEINDAGHEVLS